MEIDGEGGVEDYGILLPRLRTDLRELELMGSNRGSSCVIDDETRGCGALVQCSDEFPHGSLSLSVSLRYLQYSTLFLLLLSFLPFLCFNAFDAETHSLSV